MIVQDKKKLERVEKKLKTNLKLSKHNFLLYDEGNNNFHEVLNLLAPSLIAEGQTSTNRTTHQTQLGSLEVGFVGVKVSILNGNQILPEYNDALMYVYEPLCRDYDSVKEDRSRFDLLEERVDPYRDIFLDFMKNFQENGVGLALFATTAEQNRPVRVNSWSEDGFSYVRKQGSLSLPLNPEEFSYLVWSSQNMLNMNLNIDLQSVNTNSGGVSYYPVPNYACQTVFAGGLGVLWYPFAV